MTEETQSTLEELIATRKEKLEQLRELGIKPYAYEYDVTHYAEQILNDYDKFAETVDVRLAGRLMSIRRMGKASFAHIQDSTGKIQIYVKVDNIGEQMYEAFKLLDIGDWIGVAGKVMKTRTGEITILTEELSVLSKGLRPIPVVKETDDKVYDAFSDKEQRYRQRYLDFIVNPEVKEVFKTRSAIIRNIRHFMDERGFIEVETPVLQPIYGGASARPFKTHHNTLDTDFYLRIADELYLKRLIVGGFEKVYEIAKDFRNEGMDRNHNPEFTMLEWYQAFVDYEHEMEMVEALISEVAAKTGHAKIQFGEPEIDLTPPFARKKMFELFEEYLGTDIKDYDRDELFDFATEQGIEVDDDMNYGKILDSIFGDVVEPNLIRPTFVIDYPRAVSPLAKVKRDGDERIVERFELIVAGMEMANAFSELNDPINQRERLEQQAQLRSEGDDEAQVVDEDFLTAMEIGMPPTGGVGIGVDRLVMLLTNQHSIKDVILFPQMRPQSDD
ncbi:MAG: Lysine--tRNA ligase [Candidatus Marinimicrobia bacterium]|nr:Lysine--tRNA ligase [Candidatus Neomarinimicrobiota bacterium]